MNAEELRKLHSAQPFKPFDIHLADRRTLTVNHPEQLAIGGRMVGIADPDGVIELVDMFLIVSAKPRVNGSHRHRSRRR